MIESTNEGNPVTTLLALPEEVATKQTSSNVPTHPAGCSCQNLGVQVGEGWSKSMLQACRWCSLQWRWRVCYRWRRGEMRMVEEVEGKNVGDEVERVALIHMLL